MKEWEKVSAKFQYANENDRKKSRKDVVVK